MAVVDVSSIQLRCAPKSFVEKETPLGSLEKAREVIRGGIVPSHLGFMGAQNALIVSGDQDNHFEVSTVKQKEYRGLD